MLTRLVPLAAGLVLTGCVTGAPNGEAGMCQAMMTAMHQGGGRRRQPLPI